MRPITVTIIEDDAAYRDTLATILRGAPGFALGGTYASAEEALRDGARPPADVTLADICLPGLSGIEFVSAFKQRCPEALVLMLTVVEDTELLFRALKAGANGYLLKSTPFSGILDSIREAKEGGAPMSRAIARKVLQHFHASREPKSKLPPLTAREAEVLSQLATGLTFKEIADRLGVAEETIRTHLRNLYRKLHVHSRTEAAVKFLRNDGGH